MKFQGKFHSETQLLVFECMMGRKLCWVLLTHSFGSKEVVVKRSEPLPGVITAVSPPHEVFNHQSNVNEADAVVWGQVALENKKVLQPTTASPSTASD